MHFRLSKVPRSWRDFLREVGIVVLGVLIALGGEQFVEHQQWREKARAAEDSMRIELRDDDAPQAYIRLAIAPCLDRLASQLIEGSSADAPRPDLAIMANRYAVPIRTFDSEAWKTVLASDVGSHIAADRLISWSLPYRKMPQMSDLVLAESELETDLHQALPLRRTPSADNLSQLRRIAAQLRRLNVVQARAASLLLYRAGLLDATLSVDAQRHYLDEARAYYGNCVRPPDLRTVPPPIQITTEENLRRLSVPEQ